MLENQEATYVRRGDINNLNNIDEAAEKETFYSQIKKDARYFSICKMSFKQPLHAKQKRATKTRTLEHKHRHLESKHKKPKRI